MTIFGVDAPGGQRAQHRTIYGQLGVTRYFYGFGEPFGWAVGGLRERHFTDTPFVSVKTWNAAAFRKMLDDAPKLGINRWYFCYYHEPEDNIRRGTLDLNAFLRTWENVRKVRDSHPNGKHCKLVPTLMWYQTVHKKFPVDTLMPALELGDIIGMDCYSLRASALKNVYTPISELLGPIKRLAHDMGKPWAVPEFAVAMAADGNKARHATWLKMYAEYARANGAQWVSYWCHTGGAYAPHLCTDPAYALSLAAWKKLVRT